MIMQRISRVTSLGLLGLAALLTAGCGGSDPDTDIQDSINTTSFSPLFDPTAGIIPFPNNLLFSGTQDGTINIPVTNAGDFTDPQVAINSLDGFSTQAPISARFSGAIDASTVIPGTTVRVFEATIDDVAASGAAATFAVTSITRELTPGTEYVATLSSVDATGSTLVILPMAPLDPKTGYVVALTDGLKGSDGTVATAPLTYALAKSSDALVDGGGVSQFAAITDAQAQALEPLRQLTNITEAQIQGFTITADVGSTITDLAAADIVLSWSFITQSTTEVLGTVRTVINLSAPTSAVNPTSIGTTLTFVGPPSPGAADVYVGSLTLPYYLTAATGVNDTGPLFNWWRAANPAFAGDTDLNLTQFNPLPASTGNQTIPLLVTLPNGTSGQTKPGAGWPVVIFQHGITANRTNLLAIADALALAGFAAVAIDMPLHGLPSGHPLDSTIERTFYVDLVNNTTGALGPDTVEDTSGAHFINLRSLMTSRDNLRQAVADLFSLRAALPAMDVDGGGADFDTAGGNVYYVGHSLGAMVGTVFAALEPGVSDTVLGMPGGGIAKLLDGSPTFGPVIAGGLAGNGVDKGTADYESFLGAAQTLVDSGDPNNHAIGASTGRGVLLFEVVGDGASNLPDQVIPNNVFAGAPAGTVPSPVAGTDPLATLMGLTIYDATVTTGSDLGAWVRFSAGGHSSLLDPTASASALSEMQTQTAAFLANTGNAPLPIGTVDPSVIAAAP